MITQYIIIAIILVACLGYATFSIWKAVDSARKCKEYKCAGCPLYEKCEKNKKKVGQKFGGTK